MAIASTKPAILRLTMTIGETSAPYNQFTLPQRSRQTITLCSYLPATATPPPDLRVVEGDGSVLGYLRSVRPLLRDGAYDVIHVHDAVVANLFLLLVLLTNPRLLAITVFTVHNSYENFKLRNRLLLLPVFLFFRKVVGCSKASYESFPWYYRMLAGKRLTYVQNGMDIERVDRILATINDRSEPMANSQPFTILSVGRLIEIKNPLALLEAFIKSDLPNARLVYIGIGPYDERLKARAAAAGVADQVELTGLVPRDEVYRQLAAADLLVSTSYGEGLPIAILEAMACRTPVVLSAIQPHREIADTLAGIPLLDADDSDGFARAIQHFAAMSNQERAEIGARCRRHVDDYFSLAQMHRGYDAIYAEVMGSGGGGFAKQRLVDG